MFQDQTLQTFTEKLSSAEPVPGGGGAAALVGALAAALGEMVANLSIGKPKYAAHEAELSAARKRLYDLREKLLYAIDADAAAFLPLSEAYRLPNGPEKDAVMAKALLVAAKAPLDAMEWMAAALAPLEVLAEKGSRLAVSDAAAGAVLLSSAIRAMSLNVFINTAAMADKRLAAELNARADRLLSGSVSGAEALHDRVSKLLKENRS